MTAKEKDKTVPESGQSADPAAERARVLRSVGTVAGITLVSRVAGYGRDIVATYFFGTGLYADAFVAACVAGGLRPGALRAIAGHRAQGHNLILATASFDFYVEPLGRELGFDSVVATRSAWDRSGRLLGRIDGENCYGAEKLRRLEEALPDLRSNYRVVAYSDSHVDLPLLRWAHEGVAVNPSRRLRRRARSGGLDVVDWNAAP